MSPIQSDEDLYGGGGGQAAAPADDASSSKDSTAVVPKAVFGGKPTPPGTRCEFKVVADHGDEVQIQYVSNSSKEESSEAQSSPEMDSMME